MDGERLKLQADWDIWREEVHSHNWQLSNARKSYFSDIITKNSHNAQVLFATVDRLTNTLCQWHHNFIPPKHAMALPHSIPTKSKALGKQLFHQYELRIWTVSTGSHYKPHGSVSVHYKQRSGGHLTWTVLHLFLSGHIAHWFFKRFQRSWSQLCSWWWICLSQNHWKLL